MVEAGIEAWRISSSVYATSTPSAVKVSRFVVCAEREGVDPTMKWACIPTPSILIPRAFRVFTTLSAAVDFPPALSML